MPWDTSYERPAARQNDGRIVGLLVARISDLDGSPGLQINVRCPVDGRVVFRGDQLAVLSIQNIKEPVLGSLHYHPAHVAVYLEVSQHDVLRGGVVPGFSWHCLVVPSVGPVIGI